MPEWYRTALPPSSLGGLGEQHPVGACGRALRARVGVAGMQRGAWRTAAVMEEAGGAAGLAVHCQPNLTTPTPNTPRVAGRRFEVGELAN